MSEDTARENYRVEISGPGFSAVRTTGYHPREGQVESFAIALAGALRMANGPRLSHVLAIIISDLAADFVPVTKKIVLAEEAFCTAANNLEKAWGKFDEYLAKPVGERSGLENADV